MSFSMRFVGWYFVFLGRTEQRISSRTTTGMEEYTGRLIMVENLARMDEQHRFSDTTLKPTRAMMSRKIISGIPRSRLVVPGRGPLQSPMEMMGSLARR